MTGDTVNIRRRAFTLLEILIAIGIIALLASLLVLGMRSLLSNSKGESTKVTLQSLQGMFSEFDAKTRLSKQPTVWRWWNTGTAITVDPNAGDVNFWRKPIIDTYSGFTPPPYRSDAGPPEVFDALDAPALVAEGEFNTAAPENSDASEITRNGSRQVLNTQLVMSILLSLPANRSALEKIAADRYFVPKWVKSRTSTPAAPSNPGTDGVLMTSDDSTSAVDVFYLPGNKTEFNGGRFLCIRAHTASSPASPGSDWVADKTPATPIMLDGWNNPIIFVPSTGLRVRLLNGAKDYMLNGAPDPTVRTTIILSPEGKVDLASAQPRVLVAGRPFWASAGSDGDFAKGDDNIYSFEK